MTLSQSCAILLVLITSQSSGLMAPFEFYPKGDLLLLYHQDFVEISKDTKSIRMNTEDDSSLKFDIIKPVLVSKPAALVFQGPAFPNDLSISLEFRTNISNGYLLSVIEPDSSTIFFGVSVRRKQDLGTEYPITRLEVTYMQQNQNTGKLSQKILSAVMPLKVIRLLTTQKDYVLKFNIHVTNSSIFIYSGCSSENYAIQEMIAPVDYSVATEFRPGSKVYLFSGGSVNKDYYTGLVQNMRLFRNRSSIESYCFATVEGSGGEYINRLKENFDQGSDGNVFITTTPAPTTTPPPTTTQIPTTTREPTTTTQTTQTTTQLYTDSISEKLSACKTRCSAGKCKVMDFDTKLQKCSCNDCEIALPTEMENKMSRESGFQSFNKSVIENIVLETLNQRGILESFRGPKGDTGTCVCPYNFTKEEDKKDATTIQTTQLPTPPQTTPRDPTSTPEFQTTKPPIDRKNFFKGNLNQGSLVMASQSEVEELSFFLPAGSIVLVLNTDSGDKPQLIIKISEITNSWKEINMNMGKTLQFPYKEPTSPLNKVEIKKHLVVNSPKKLYLVLINFVWRGKMRVSEIHMKCQMEARKRNLPGIFLPFLGFEKNKMEDLVQSELRSSYPIVNINNETLFYSWNAIFRGSLINDQVPLLTFDGKDVLRTDKWRSKFLWVGRKLSEAENTAPPTCLEWTTSNPLETGVAINMKKKDFLVGAESKSCGTANYVACIQSTRD